MMENKVKAWLYQIPAILLLFVILIGGIYAQVSGAYTFKGGTGAFVFFMLVILIIIICFFIGKYYDRKIGFL